MKTKYFHNTLECLHFIAFLGSFVNSTFLIVYFMLIGIIALTNPSWRIKGMIWLSLRTVINNRIADPGNTASQILKWIVIFELSFLCLMNGFSRAELLDKRKIKKLLLILLVFSAYIGMQSLLTSGYPVTSIFKLVSYAIVFIAAVIGVANTKGHIHWFSYLYFCLKCMMVLSILIFPVRNVSYSVASLYQGITNQSNMFGVISALYFSLFYFNLYRKNCGKADIIIAIASFILAVLSKSRNGLLAIVVLTGLYCWISDYSKQTKTLVTIVLLLIGAIILTMNTSVRDSLLKYIYKTDDIEAIMSGNRDVFFSRHMQQDAFELKFSQNILFGTGFAVPYNYGMQDWNLYLSLIYEPGNLLFALLGDVGIIGTILFGIMYLYIFLKRSCKESVLLYLAPFLVCIGEMVFFSTNNVAMLLYVMFGIVLME